jgi:hypothetical protein
MDDVEINKQKCKVDEEVPHESFRFSEMIAGEVKERSENGPVQMSDQKSPQIGSGECAIDGEETKTSSFDMNLPSESETSVQMKLMKPKLPNLLNLQPNQVAIKSTNADFIPDIKDVKYQSISKLNPEIDIRQSTSTKDMGLSLSQVDEPFNRKK